MTMAMNCRRVIVVKVVVARSGSCKRATLRKQLAFELLLQTGLYIIYTAYMLCIIYNTYYIIYNIDERLTFQQTLIKLWGGSTCRKLTQATQLLRESVEVIQQELVNQGNSFTLVGCKRSASMRLCCCKMSTPLRCLSSRCKFIACKNRCKVDRASSGASAAQACPSAARG